VQQLITHPPCPSPFSSAFRAPCPLCCMFLMCYSGFIFWWVRDQSVQGAVLVYPKGGCGSTTCHLFAHLLVYVYQAGLEPVSGSVGSLLFSLHNLAWRSPVWAEGSGCQSFILLGVFFLPSVAPVSQQNS
jgi:hypothetical protein